MINANLSLIMPTRNVQGMVSKILNGISELQWKNIHKLVIIDNGSSDNTISEVHSFITNTTYESKIHLHENGKDLGYGFSIKWGLNFLVQDLKNEFIGIIHADDQFSSKALIDLYFSNLSVEHHSVFLVNRKRDPLATHNFRQKLRNLGNFIISFIGRFSTGSKLRDFNTPFFLISNTLSKRLLSEYNFGDDIFFHPRINMIFASQFYCNASECNWKRASKTTRIPITAMGFQILFMYVKFGVCYRFLKYDAKKSYGVATHLLIS